ncbi:MAG: 2-C-methyl-D-erythritol 2,4-cyclodiphosphate synthase [Ruminococcaceae bacterium]|nr:2-C-methyl-D-erythritol 2,4-cyclodiphosphate synthase [Oscillospiraceae bacterium]
MMRIGHGYDVHRYKEGRRCIFCGVEIPVDFGPDGHSDADVAVHALMDALLGAVALGDIGRHFPDNDSKYKNADSMKLLDHVMELVAEKGYSVGNVDITVIAQKPRLAAYIPDMVKNLAACLNVSEDRVNVKATTEEKMGFTGSGEGVAAHAVVVLTKNE